MKSLDAFRFALVAFGLACLGMLSASAQPGAAASHGRLPLDLVVMVHAVGGPGAGLVVGQSDARTTIVTARHLFLDRDNTIVTQNIRVEFSALRGTSLAARVVDTYIDRRLDLAVLFVDHGTAVAVPRLSPAQLAEAVSPAQPAALKGEAVRVVGAARRPWNIAPPGDTVVGASVSRLLIGSAGARPGDSGGGVFDVFGRLLGMVSEFDVSRGELHVVPMIEIRRRLQQWGIEFLLGTAGVPTGGPELLEALRKQSQLTIRPPTDDRQQGYRLQVKVSDSLARLHPTFRVAFPELVSIPTVRLAGPAFEALAPLAPVALTAELWMDTVEGRQTGPVRYRFDLAALAQEALAGKYLPLDANVDTLKKNQRAHDLAMAQARLQNQAASFWNSETVAKNSAAISEKVTAMYGAERAQAFKTQVLRDIPIRFERMRATCANRPGLNWLCVVDGVAPYQVGSGRLDDVLSAIRIGQRSTVREGVLAPALEVSLNPTDAVDKGVKTTIERMLAEGAKAIHAEIVFADGQRLGPNILCEVGDGPVHGNMCRPPLPRPK